MNSMQIISGMQVMMVMTFNEENGYKESGYEERGHEEEAMRREP